jgi:hypothetical protein
VEIVAFGSVVRRLVAFLVKTPFASHSELPNLFKLAHFLSDIDLRHTGSSKQTASIRNAILSRVPFAEYFRWDISLGKIWQKLANRR